MRKMWSKGQLKNIAVEGIAGQDIAPNDVSASGSITGDEIIENMSGYSLTKQTTAGVTKDWTYAGAVKNGNKLTFAVAIEIKRSSDFTNDYMGLCLFNIPSSVGQKIYPSTLAGLNNGLSIININAWSAFTANAKTLRVAITKSSNTAIDIQVLAGLQSLTAETTYYARFEVTFLLSENLAE